MKTQVDAIDPIGGLGPKVTPAPAPAPQPHRRPDGIVIGPDGKWSTDLPDPSAAVSTPMPPPAEDAAAKCASPVQIWDMVRLLLSAIYGEGWEERA
jgi:hypothetical protein